MPGWSLFVAHGALVVATSAAPVVRWEQIEPALRIRFALDPRPEGRGFDVSDNAQVCDASRDLPSDAEAAITEAIEATRGQLALSLSRLMDDAQTVGMNDGLAQGTAFFQNGLFADARAARVLR